MHRVLVMLVASACGRIGFDPHPSGVDAPPSAYRAAVLADGPAGYWRLADLDSIARDETGRTDGTYSGTCTHDVPGALVGDANTATHFDAGGCMVDLTNGFAFAGTAPYTLEAWAAFEVIGYEHLITRQVRGAMQPIDGYALLESPTGIYGERSVNLVDPATPIEPVTPGPFIHVVTVYDGAQLLLYLDGVVVGTGAATALAMRSYDARVLVGQSPSGNSGMRGTIDEVAIYDVALTAAQIAHHHAVGIDM